MLPSKRLIPAILLSCCSTASYAQVQVDITSKERDQASAVQQFAVSITSDVPLKYVEKTTLSPESCEQYFYFYKPETVNSQTYSSRVTYNYKEHSWANGESLCLFVEDENGEQYSFSSEAQISLIEPKFKIEQAESIGIKSYLGKEDEYGLNTNTIDFVYQPKDTANPISFNLSGQIDTGLQLTLKETNSNRIIQQVSNENGQWRLDDIALDISASSRYADHSFELVGSPLTSPDVKLFSKRLKFSGKNLLIEFTQKPQVPIDVSLLKSGIARWKVDTAVTITQQRLLMLSDAEQCQQQNPSANVVIDVENASFNVFDFLKSPQTHGHYACLQVEDELGNLFTQDIGWVRKLSLPEFVISDDISDQPVHIDNFSGYVSGAEKLSINYISDEGILSREQILEHCKDRVKGVPLEANSFELTLSEETLHDRYVCLKADNGKGGVSHWVSEHKVNLHDGLSIVQNNQQRYTPTAFPTKLAIPENLHNSTINNIGCRSVFLSEDLMMSAGHCIAHAYHPTNGVWSSSPEMTVGYLLAKDEKAHAVYDRQKSEIAAYYFANKDTDENIDSDWLIEQFLSIIEFSEYRTGIDLRVYLSPYFGYTKSAAFTFADFVLYDLATPYDGDSTDLEYPQPLVYTYPSEVHLTPGEFRSHGGSEEFPQSAWLGGNIHTSLPPGENTSEYLMVNTFGGESGSALWAYDAEFDTYGVIGSVRGNGAWSSVWNHARVTRQALANSRAKTLNRRIQDYQGISFSYRDLRRAVVNSDATLIDKIVDSGISVNLDKNGQQDGWMLAKAVNIAVQANAYLLKRETPKRLQRYQSSLDTIKSLILGGADPRLTVQKPTRAMEIESGDSVLHYAVRANLPKVMEAIWLNTTNYDYESVSRQVTNDAGDTPLHLAIDKQVDLSLFKLLFTDVGQDLFIKNAQGKSSLAILLEQENIDDKQVSYIDWIGKAFSYEPIKITNEGNISHSDWVPLLCHRFNYQGADHSFKEFAQLQSGILTPQAVAVIANLGNRSGVDASKYCQ